MIRRSLNMYVNDAFKDKTLVITGGTGLLVQPF